MVIGAVVFFNLLTRAQPLAHSHALDDDLFQSCDEVLSRAVGLSADIRESAYVMELYPKSLGSLAYPFPSEVTAASAAELLRGAHPTCLPFCDRENQPAVSIGSRLKSASE